MTEQKHSEIELAADVAYKEFVTKWKQANSLSRGDMGTPTSIEIWHHAFRAGLKSKLDADRGVNG